MKILSRILSPTRITHTAQIASSLGCLVSLTVSLAACSSPSSTNSATPTNTANKQVNYVSCQIPESANFAATSISAENTTDNAAKGNGATTEVATMPESATGFRTNLTATHAKNFAVSTANPLATKAACDVLSKGGSAADALVAAQFTLGLVEPQSSGIGGGGYILYSDAASGKLIAIDGRETAPVNATGDYLLNAQPDARRSGRSIGVPGIVAALDKLHQRYGQQSWESLTQPAHALAQDGFAISQRMATSIADNAQDLASDPEAAAYFLHEDGSPKTTGEILKNPAYAHTLETLATQGAQALYTGELAKDIVDKATSNQGGKTPSTLTTADLAAYTPIEQEAVCAPYRDKIICGAPPSSSGGITVLSALGILENADLAALAPEKTGLDGALPSAQALHLISEAERLAYADRDAYIADPAFAPLPGGNANALLNSDYLAQRYQLINPEKSMGTATAGTFDSELAPTEDLVEHGTSHISVIDAQGNAASMTTSVEAAFGSFHMVDGFLLNNQLTDFSAQPLDEQGVPIANRVEGAKRPRSSMSPTIIFNAKDNHDRGEVYMVVGSPGGAVIPQFVIKTIISVLDWKMDPQQAISSPDFGARNTPETGIGGEHPLLATNNPEVTKLINELEQRGHSVSTKEQSSGLSALIRDPDGHIIGGADPRREGIVLGG
ncbi:gamma-glutamyltransferase [Corynebacterium sp. sy017]|uniref:gamma-glutamyltransferase n=1 Tax=unclassified Corynebacterium TaxID=2624378 RepID=UPI001184E356|nr:MULTISPECIES: gamma-glutamyltransferase [unclassified Corynebacterium]MBP3088599.1 gamma-glutamyltransferase [Corynebacterium sp. sy017]TSD91893.1 gamma-glutamyltransferase [Corynebacterium sp. SY003]